MSEFTKGDWHVSIVGNKTYIDSDTGLTIAEVFDIEGAPSNAHLISQLPAMYALLDELSAFLSFKVKDDTLKGLKLNVDTLLSKARGES